MRSGKFKINENELIYDTNLTNGPRETNDGFSRAVFFQTEPEPKGEMGMVSKVNLVDVYSSSFLILNNLEPQLEIKNGKVIFVFQGSDEIYRLLNLFNEEDTQVSVAKFVTAIKTLRGRMLTLKESANGTYEKGRASYVG